MSGSLEDWPPRDAVIFTIIKPNTEEKDATSNTAGGMKLRVEAATVEITASKQVSANYPPAVPQHFPPDKNTFCCK